MPARMAIQAWDMMMQGDSFADMKSPHLRSHSRNRPCGFVSENARGRYGPELDLLDIGGTHPADGHLYKDLIGCDARHWQGLDPQIVDPAINRRSHAQWRFVHSSLSTVKTQIDIA